ncbi:Mismatch repair ATPase MSH2 (MutS family) [Trachipleistophora hominis]|uniref:Mismatch repair ATPase MSH2 (MutS family) n=1 Tax=Trachipleistophora hominis TaxID=72359 RepID=L7JSY7_TRAHO|nr:Mismatch repair ATPase MSH2 (MutS family) [Trachipleistophora hominis]
MARDAFHPLVNNCIKNDINVNFTILTGPNTAGKSTFLKTIALTVILGQMGSLVPGREVKFELRDGIYIRSGASDKYGISTFMREMKDIARITNMCTEKSLILIDELGRGTSYIDGISLSVAIKEYLLKKKALAVFATHFTGKNEKMFLDGQDVDLLCSEVVDGVITYKIKKGVANSLGIDVAKRVGFPKEVINAAEKYLNE